MLILIHKVLYDAENVLGRRDPMPNLSYTHTHTFNFNGG